MKYYTYVLYSQKYDKIYIGFTNNLMRRLHFHNQGIKGWTAKFIPWELVYHEEFETKAEAMKREQELKSYQGRKFIHEEVLSQR
ncbi:MAG: GIY-YIG nuclease family protein [Candidatus Cloacimonadia bacterium]